MNATTYDELRRKLPGYGTRTILCSEQIKATGLQKRLVSVIRITGYLDSLDFHSFILVERDWDIGGMGVNTFTPEEFTSAVRLYVSF